MLPSNSPDLDKVKYSNHWTTGHFTNSRFMCDIGSVRNDTCKFQLSVVLGTFAFHQISRFKEKEIKLWGREGPPVQCNQLVHCIFWVKKACFVPALIFYEIAPP